MRRFWLVLAIALTVLPSSAVVAQDDEILVERVLGAGEPQVCENLHIVVTCDYRHFSGMETTPAGTVVMLDDRPYSLVWKGNAYYLDSGIILHPVGLSGPSLAGQQWVEAYPSRGRTLTSQAWRDLDSDGLLSPADTLVFAGGLEAKVKDVRFNFVLKPLGAQE
jgi:hypothetical protein